jgi:hypothetical protein
LRVWQFQTKCIKHQMHQMSSKKYKYREQNQLYM